MNKKLVACTLLALLPAMALGITLYRAKILANPSSTDRIVDPRGPPYGTYKTISAALAASADGDVIWVNNGTYNEQLLVNKSVTIKSSFPSNRAVVNGSSTGMGFYVNASNVQLINLTIQNAREGICLSPTAIDTTLIGNVVRSNTYGISVNSGDNFLRNNTMTGNAENFGISNFTGNNIDTSNTVSGKSVYYLVNKRNIVLDNLTFPQIGYLALVNSANVTVKNLELSNNDDGVKFVNTSNSTIENVEVSSNGDGVDLFNVTNSIIGNVNARNNSDGVYLNGVSDSIIENVNASNNSFDGISLEASTSNQIAGNDVLNNSFGIDLENCTDNVFTGNVIRSSVQYACGVLLTSTHSNVFYHNNFKMPTFQPSVYQVRVFNSSESWDNGAEGNYWSDYRTNNPNAKEYMGTGIWDTAYEIVGSTPPQYDRYPLYSQWNSVRLFKVAKTISNALDIYGNYKIVVNSDHVIANLNFTKPPPGHYYPLQLSFNITAGSSGFCNITIPRAWLDGPFSLTINNALPPFLSIKTLNENYTSLYFTYVPGKYQVKIIGTRSATLLSFDVTGTGKINMIDIGLLASLFNAKIDMTCYDVTQYDP